MSCRVCVNNKKLLSIRYGKPLPVILTQEVSANPLLGLTHLRDLGKDYLSLCATFVKCLLGMNEPQKIHGLFLLGMSEGPWLVTPQSP